MQRLLGRIAAAPIIILGITAAIYALPRLTRPELYPPGDPVLGGVLHDVGRIYLHGDLGRACGWKGCPEIWPMWSRGAIMDLWLLGGAMFIGVAAGVAGGMYCAAHPRTRAARALESLSTLVYCTPVYVLGLGLLLLFNPIFGRFPLPFFFDARARWASPFSDPWSWLRTLLVPWLVLGAPLAAMCLRLTLSTTIEALDEDYVRTAVAKGLSHRAVVRRHAGRASRVATASLASVATPLLILNVVLVERALSVPGFFRYTWKATGHPPSPDPADKLVPDIPMTAALMLWAAVLTVVVSLLLDFVVARLDPRVRDAV
jgi:peptide/nickel transport system permease protein